MDTGRDIRVVRIPPVCAIILDSASHTHTHYSTACKTY